MWGGGDDGEGIAEPLFCSPVFESVTIGYRVTVLFNIIGIIYKRNSYKTSLRAHPNHKHTGKETVPFCSAQLS